MQAVILFVAAAVAFAIWKCILNAERRELAKRDKDMYDSLIAMLRANSEEDRKYYRERREEHERLARERREWKAHLDNLAD